MANFGKILKSGLMGGLAGAAAKAGGVSMNDVARKGGLGLAGMLLAKKKKQAQAAVAGAPTMRGRPAAAMELDDAGNPMMRKGGKVKKMAKGGSASRRADGCATKGKTKGKFV